MSAELSFLGKNILELKELIEDCYRKYKSSIYYQPSLSYQKKQIAEFEYDRDIFASKIESLTKALVFRDDNYFKRLSKDVDFFVIPKKLKDESEIESKNKRNLISNTQNDDNVEITEVNFFFNGPIELFIIETLLTIQLGRFFYNSNTDVKTLCYANRFHPDLYDSTTEINYKNLFIFDYYYKLYKKWKNGAIEASYNLFKNKNDSSIISLDLTGYYYSIDCSILDIIKSSNSKIELENDELFLINVIQQAFDVYTQHVYKYRKSQNGNKTILPIGLNISKLLANLFLINTDKILNDKTKFYARYVDDIIFVVDNCSLNNMKDVCSYLDDVFVCDGDVYKLKSNQYITIKQDKCRIIKNFSSGSKHIFKKLRKEEYSISEYNLFPDFDADVNTIINDAYEKQEYIKIRDFQQIKIDPSKISKVTNGVVTITKGTTIEDKGAKYKNYSKNLLYTLSNSDLLMLNSKWERN